MVVGEDCIPTDADYIIDNVKTVLEKIFGSRVQTATLTSGGMNTVVNIN